MQRPKITTENVAPTIEGTIDISSNIAMEDIDRPDIHVMSDGDPNSKYIRDLAFMEEQVTFIVAKTKDKNDPDPIISGCNGQNLIVELGKPVKAARKFLNSLINTVMDISTSEYIDEQGLKQTRISTLHSPSLQIQLMDDPSGQKGFDWFARAQHGIY